MASTDQTIQKDKHGRATVSLVTDDAMKSAKGGFPFNAKEGSNIKKAKGHGQKKALARV